MPRAIPFLLRLLAGLALPVGGGARAADLDTQLHALFAAPALAGIRWGFVVLDDRGTPIVAIAPDERFVPASTTKIFTTAAAFARLPGIERPDPARGTAIRLVPRPGGAPDVLLAGGGDATLSDAAGCAADCLATLAGAVAARGVTHVHDVIGDDTRFPDERWGQGWSWNTLQTRSGTAVSALTIDDNELGFTIAPGARPGDRARIAWDEADGYDGIDDQLLTVAGGVADIRIDRPPGSRTVRVSGTLPLGTAPRHERIAIEDPADRAAFRLRRRLAARGIAVEGQVRVRHRAPGPGDDPARRGTVQPVPLPGEEIARLIAPPLAEDLRDALKASRNLHAELGLRLLGRAEGGNGSVADGLALAGAVLDSAGAPRAAWDLADGSGMSTYNRVTPRMTARYLLWAGRQPWGAAWAAGLPVAGVDGTLRHRFVGTPLAGRLQAKTGTLAGVNALAGFLTGASGRRYAFALFAADQPSGIADATAAMDRALLLVAAAG